MKNPTNSTGSRTTTFLLLGALGVVMLLCVCGIGAYILLNTTGVITTQVNLLVTKTPTVGTLVSTSTAELTTATTVSTDASPASSPSATLGAVTPTETAALDTTAT